VALRDGGYFRGHITMVDAGMVAQLDPKESSNFVGLIAAMGPRRLFIYYNLHLLNRKMNHGIHMMMD